MNSWSDSVLSESNETYPRSGLTFTSVQRELVKIALSGKTAGRIISFEQRSALRQICSAPALRTDAPERLLIAFKHALMDAADEARIPFGRERDDLLARLISVFIEELFRDAGGVEGARKTPMQEASVAGGP
jgi:hypothetical protein